MRPIPIQRFSGPPGDIGRAHGLAFADEIRRLAAERIQLAQDPLYTGHRLTRAAVLAIAEACLPAHRAFSADHVDEMQGMADAAGLSLAEMLVAGGFTDFVDTVSAVAEAFVSPRGEPSHERGGQGNMAAPATGGLQTIARPNGPHRPVRRLVDDCTAFIVPDNLCGGAGYIGQTWDMHASAAEHVFLMQIRPAGGLRATIFTSQGCLGMIGMNEAGLAVGINNLAGDDGQIGVTWPLVIRRMLSQTTADAALECIRTTTLAGAHNYLIMDAGGAGYNVEAMSTRLGVTALGDGPLVHTNHCLLGATADVEKERLPAQVEASERRLRVAQAKLNEAAGGGAPISAPDLMGLTREPSAICVRPVAPKFVATCGAVIMRPRTGELWAVAGPPTEGEFVRVSV